MGDQTQQQILALLAAQAAAAQNNMQMNLFFPQMNWGMPNAADMMFWNMAQMSHPELQHHQQQQQPQESFEDVLRKMTASSSKSANLSNGMFFYAFFFLYICRYKVHFGLVIFRPSVRVTFVRSHQPLNRFEPNLREWIPVIL